MEVDVEVAVGPGLEYGKKPVFGFHLPHKRRIKVAIDVNLTYTTRLAPTQLEVAQSLRGSYPAYSTVTTNFMCIAIFASSV
jgi:hypothetical protein